LVVCEFEKNIFVIVIVEAKNVLNNIKSIVSLLNLHWIDKIRIVVGFEVKMSKFRGIRDDERL
jgi:hypothetical protein